jgi:predicted  nucleic acid-binding Zn-ribbon protein
MIPLLGEIWLWTLLSLLTGLGIGWWIWHNSNLGRVTTLEGELGQARRAADDAAAARTRVEKELAESNAKIMPLMSSNTSTAADLEKLRRELATAKSDDASDDAEIARLRKELADCNGKGATLASTNAALTTEVATLKRDLAAARSDDASDDAEIARLRKELDAARAAHAGSEGLVAQLRGTVSNETELLGFRSDYAKRTEKLPLFLDKPRGVPDDLRLIKGVGEKLNTMLTSIGIFHFRQIANWTDADIDQVDAKLEIFKGRIKRDDWVSQAKLLAAGKHDEFERLYGKMGENN